MAVRASVDNCTAGAEAATANKKAGIETLTNDFNKSILHSCGSSRIHVRKPTRKPVFARTRWPTTPLLFHHHITLMAGSDAPSRPAWPFTSVPAKPCEPQGGAPESWFADRTQSIDASTRFPAHRQPREAGRSPRPQQARPYGAGPDP